MVFRSTPIHDQQRLATRCNQNSAMIKTHEGGSSPRSRRRRAASVRPAVDGNWTIKGGEHERDERLREEPARPRERSELAGAERESAPSGWMRRSAFGG